MPLNIQTSDARQAKVYDVANPDRHGKVISAGPQQSEVRFDDGVSRIVSNAHLHPVADDGFSQLNPSPVSEVIRLGQEAMARKRRGWDDWLLIAEALQAARRSSCVECRNACIKTAAAGRRCDLRGNYSVTPAHRGASR
jgi:hypothetical protein